MDSITTYTWPSCSSGKRGFPDRESAHAQLRRAKGLRRDDPSAGRIPGRVEQACYECPACRWWHLASSRRRMRRGDFARRDRRRRP